MRVDRPLKLTCAVGIATYQRHDMLRLALSYLTRQTRLPDEILVADASDDGALSSQRMPRELPELAKVPKYLHFVTPRGSAAQRNKILDRTCCDVVVFLDDDSLADPVYLEKILQVYEADTAALVGGIEGTALENAAFALPPQPDSVQATSRDGSLTRLKRLLRQFAGGIDRWIVKRLLGEYFPKKVMEPVHDVPPQLQEFPVAAVRALHGCVMSFRTPIARKYRFNEHLKLYAYMEDFELSYRISKKYALLRCHNAMAQHLRFQDGRLHPSVVTYLAVINMAYIARTAMDWGPDLRRHLRRYAGRWQFKEMLVGCLKKSHRQKFQAIRAARAGCEHIFAANDEQVHAVYELAAQQVLGSDVLPGHAQDGKHRPRPMLARSPEEAARHLRGR